MTERYVVLLRGVNVGGVTVRSADLRAALGEAGFTDVRTVLASGNALVTAAEADTTSQTVRERVEASLRARFERDIRVVVRTQSDLGTLADACPYPADSETHHAYVVFLGDADGAARAYAAVAAAAPIAVGEVTADDAAVGTAAGDDAARDEAVTPGQGVLYWWCPRGSSLTTPVSTAVATLSRSALTTTRNLRTVLRLTTG